MVVASSKIWPTHVFPGSFHPHMFQVSEMVGNMFLGFELGEKHEFLGFEPFRIMGVPILGHGGS